MYFPLFKLIEWGKRSCPQPQTIYSEFPYILLCFCIAKGEGLNRSFVPLLYQFPRVSQEDF